MPGAGTTATGPRASGVVAALWNRVTSTGPTGATQAALAKLALAAEVEGVE